MNGEKPRRRVQQNLTKLLGRLRAEGVSTVRFHPDGRLAFVSFAQPEVPESAERRGRPPKQDPPHIAAARRAFAVIQGTADPAAMDEA